MPISDIHGKLVKCGSMWMTVAGGEGENDREGKDGGSGGQG